MRECTGFAAECPRPLTEALRDLSRYWRGALIHGNDWTLIMRKMRHKAMPDLGVKALRSVRAIYLDVLNGKHVLSLANQSVHTLPYACG